MIEHVHLGRGVQVCQLAFTLVVLWLRGSLVHLCPDVRRAMCIMSSTPQKIVASLFQRVCCHGPPKSA